MDTETLVYADIEGVPLLVGRLWARMRKDRESATFEYSLDLATAVAEYFELDARAARAIAAEVGRAVATWRQVAARLGLTQAEIERMASAFEHVDLSAAAAL